MNVTIIGCGKMGCAMARGLLKSGLVSAQDLVITNRSGTVPQALEGFSGLRFLTDNRAACADSDFILLAVLPQRYGEVLPEIRDAAREGACLLSIAPGYSVQQIAEMTGNRFRVIRAMPNTPAVIGEGMIAVCENPSVPEKVFGEALELFSALGRTEVIREDQLNAVIGVSGSAPAYFFVFLDALADAGVLGGLHREQAVRLAEQTMLGCARLAIGTGDSPSALRDMVCSPGGTTIEAVAKLEETGFRSAVIQAARAAMEKAEKMAGK